MAELLEQAGARRLYPHTLSPRQQLRRGSCRYGSCSRRRRSHSCVTHRSLRWCSAGSLPVLLAAPPAPCAATGPAMNRRRARRARRTVAPAPPRAATGPVTARKPALRAKATVGPAHPPVSLSVMDVRKPAPAARALAPRACAPVRPASRRAGTAASTSRPIPTIAGGASPRAGMEPVRREHACAPKDGSTAPEVSSAAACNATVCSRACASAAWVPPATRDARVCSGTAPGRHSAPCLDPLARCTPGR